MAYLLRAETTYDALSRLLTLGFRRGAYELQIDDACAFSLARGATKIGNQLVAGCQGAVVVHNQRRRKR